jgi:hypothetical protein
LSSETSRLDLVHSPGYNFALHFLRSVEGFHDAELPPDAQFLAILERLPNYPKKVINATLPDTVKTILMRSEDWDPSRVAKADATLAALDCLTLTDMREQRFKRKPR